MAATQDQVDVELIEAPPEEVPPPALKEGWPKWAKWALAAGLAGAVVTGVLWWLSGSQKAIRYETAAVERGAVQASVTATGTVNAVVDVQVGSQVSGNIKELYADYNTKVKKGQLVALIDPAMFQAQVGQAEAAARSARAASLTAEAQVEKARADLAGALAGQKNAESVAAKDRANELNARAQWERSDTLFQAGIVSQQDHDSARATYDAYQAQVTADLAQIEAAKQNVASARAQVRVAESQAESARAQEGQSQAALQLARINLAHTRISAPVDGTVIARRMDVGQTVAASFQAPTIFEIAQDLTKMQLDTNVDESDIGNIRVGQQATFTVDAYPGTIFHGRVSDVRKAPISTQNVVTYDVVIGVSNPDLKLFPGMTANARILTQRVDDTLKVPNVVLRLRPSADILKQLDLPAVQTGKPVVYVMAGPKLKAVPVTLGISDGRYTALTAAELRSGDRVLSRITVGTTGRSGSAGPTPQRGPRF
jgi:HlyD family secretion protein